MDGVDHARYPVGRFQRPVGPLDAGTRQSFLESIEDTPAVIRTLVGGLDDRQLQRAYRVGGWTIRQVVHHLPDSHMNTYIRMKLAVTEDRPTIKPYNEARWATLHDGKDAPINPSLDLLTALHARWMVFMRSLSEQEFSREFFHPELGPMTLDQTIALYDWHGRHHAAHIRSALSR
jgi:hypothetical protein